MSDGPKAGDAHSVVGLKELSPYESTLAYVQGILKAAAKSKATGLGRIGIAQAGLRELAKSPEHANLQQVLEDKRLTASFDGLFRALMRDAQASHNDEIAKFAEAFKKLSKIGKE